MGTPNDVAKQAIIDKINKAIETEGLSVKHAAQCMGLRPAAISGMRKQKNWKHVGATEWDKARKWTNSGESLIKYAQKYIKDPVDPGLLNKLMTTPPEKAAKEPDQEIPDKVNETGRRATEEEAEKIVEKTKAIAKEFDVPAHEVAEKDRPTQPEKGGKYHAGIVGDLPLVNAPTHSMIDEIEEQVKSANEEGQYKPPDYTAIKEVEKDLIDEVKVKWESSPKEMADKMPDWSQELEKLIEKYRLKWEKYGPPVSMDPLPDVKDRLLIAFGATLRVKPIYKDKQLKYKLQKKIMLVWWNVDVFSTQEEACSIALKLSDLRQTI